jgi:hypothetical protein
MADKNFKVKTGLTLPSPLPVEQGGTGQTSASNTLNALLPLQTDNSGKVLSTDGTDTSWVAQAVAYQRGGTASRPPSPTVGDLYYNTDYNYFESYTANGWFPIAAAPGIPTGVTATNQGTSRAFNNGQMSVAFTPNSSGGAPTSFIVTPSPSTSPSTFTVSSSPAVVTGLASSTQYTYTVQSTSPYGTSSASSASSAVTATTVPGAPSSVSGTISSQTVSLTWTAPATGGSAITDYIIQYSSNSGSTWTTFSDGTSTNTSATVTGLTNGTSYIFRVAAVNINGTSSYSTSSSSLTPQIEGIPSLSTWTEGPFYPGNGGSGLPVGAGRWGQTTDNTHTSYTQAYDRGTSFYKNDGKGGTWSSAASHPTGQGLGTSSKWYTSDNRVYTVGGDTGTNNIVYSLNPSGTSWSQHTSSSVSASWGNGAYYNGYLYTINSYADGFNAARSTTNTGTSWESYGSPGSVFGMMSVPLHNKLLAWGGYTSGFASVSTAVYSTTGSGTWTSETSVPGSDGAYSPHGAVMNANTFASATYSKVYHIWGSSIYSRPHNSGTWTIETGLPDGSTSYIMGAVRGSEVWVQAVGNNAKTYYQKLL